MVSDKLPDAAGTATTQHQRLPHLPSPSALSKGPSCSPVDREQDSGAGDPVYKALCFHVFYSVSKRVQ